jgi:hypothetical protein
MSTLTFPEGALAGPNRRRLRVALFAGLAAAVLIAVFATAPSWFPQRSSSTVRVLVAAKDIKAGTTITADSVTTSAVSMSPSLLLTFLQDSDRSRVIGQTAAVGVPAGHALPDYVVSPETTAGLWAVNVPIRRMPADVTDGSHVALLVTDVTKTGDQVEHVFVQDVTALHIQSGSADLWLPPRLASQVEWYADHGGIILFRMDAGAVVPGSNLAVGAPPQ